MKRWTYKFHLTKMLEQEKTQNKGNASLCPQEIRDWVAQLTLLKGVSLSCLVGDERQLPPESIRFFTVDKNWTNQLINGSFAVGAVSEKAETFNRLFAAFPIGWTVARAGKHCFGCTGQSFGYSAHGEAFGRNSYLYLSRQNQPFGDTGASRRAALWCSRG